MNTQFINNTGFLYDLFKTSSKEYTSSELISLCKTILSQIQLNSKEISSYNFPERNFLALHLNQLTFKIDHAKKSKLQEEKQLEKLRKISNRIKSLISCISSKDDFRNTILPKEIQKLILENLKCLYEKQLPNFVKNSHTSFRSSYCQFLPQLKSFYKGNKEYLYSDIIPHLMNSDNTSHLFWQLSKMEAITVAPYLLNFNSHFTSMDQALSSLSIFPPSNKLKFLKLISCTRLTDKILKYLINLYTFIFELYISN